MYLRNDELINGVLMESGILDYADFRSAVISGLEELCGDGITVEEKKILKNNSVELYAVSIRSDSECISPAIYMESFYKEYVAGKKNIEEIRNSILRAYVNNKNVKGFDINKFKDFEEVKNRISYRLINKERNKDYLKSVPHFEMLDLAIIFSVVLDEIGGSIVIRNEHLRMWRIDENRLRECAKANSEKFYGPVLQRLDECVMNMLMSDSEESEHRVPETGSGVYILSNEENRYGASCVIDETVLRDVAESMKSGYYILPASIHEVIIIKDNMVENCADLKRMVMDVNRAAVDAEDYLSDSVYHYDYRSKKLNVAR